MGEVTWLQAEPTTVCNLECEFCYGRSMATAKMDSATFVELLDLLPPLSWVHLQGEGEPFLAPGFFGMAMEAKRRQMLCITTSNGTLFNAANVEKILDTGMASILVSLESPDPVEFRAIRGFDLEQALDGIRALQAAKALRATSLPAIGFAVTVLRSTQQRLPEIFELHRSLGLDGHINVRCLQKTHGYDDIYDDDMRAQLLDADEVARIGAIEAALMEQYFGGPLPPNHPLRDRLERLQMDIMGSTPGCFWLDSGLYVDADGDLAPCCNIKKSVFRFGHFRAVDLDAVGRERDRMQAELLAGSIPKACEGCLLAEGIQRRLRRA
jgi:MoaA/NifB/PqqE/SkfB family radical SAM enzyme